MTKEKVQKLPHGLFEIFWNSGGNSFASVGSLHNGDRWFAPTNWTNESTYGIASTDWRKVKSVRLIIGTSKIK